MLQRTLIQTSAFFSVALVLASCGGGGGGGSADTPPLSTEQNATSAVQAEWESFRTLNEDEQVAESNDIERSAFASLSAWTGLQQEIGGSEAFGNALKALAGTGAVIATARRDQIASSGQQLPTTVQAPPAARNLKASFVEQSTASAAGVAAAETSAAATYGPSDFGFLPLTLSLFETGLVGKLVIEGTNGIDTPGTVQKNDSSGGSLSSMDVSASIDKIGYGSKFEGTQDGLAIKMQTKLDMDVCPDAAGRVNIKFSSVSSVSKAGTQAGSNTSVEVSLVRTVDDNAKLTAEMEFDVHVEQAAFDSGKGTFVDADFFGQPGQADGGRVNRASSAATQADIDMARKLGTLGVVVAMQASEGIQSALESGRCVSLKPTTIGETRENVERSMSFQIFAAPRSKIDGAATGGTVKATLDGGTSLNPANQPVAADAVYSYVAPGDYEKQATVALEARSKRGAAKATVSFSTRKKADIIQKYMGSASVTWTFESGEKQTLNATDITLTFDSVNSSSVFPDAGFAQYDAQGTADVTRTVPGCATASAQLPIIGKLDVFALSGGGAYSGGYYFGFGTPTFEVVSVICGNETKPIPVGLVPVGSSAVGVDFWTPYADIGDLSGTKTVNWNPNGSPILGEHVWSFKKVE